MCENLLYFYWSFVHFQLKTSCVKSAWESIEDCCRCACGVLLPYITPSSLLRSPTFLHTFQVPMQFHRSPKPSLHISAMWKIRVSTCGINWEAGFIKTDFCRKARVVQKKKKQQMNFHCWGEKLNCMRWLYREKKCGVFVWKMHAVSWCSYQTSMMSPPPWLSWQPRGLSKQTHNTLYDADQGFSHCYHNTALLSSNSCFCHGLNKKKQKLVLTPFFSLWSPVKRAVTEFFPKKKEEKCWF